MERWEPGFGDWGIFCLSLSLSGFPLNTFTEDCRSFLSSPELEFCHRLL
ncbi:MAG: hypothetical protein KME26_09410 [Oscillatoria princeps RMCB-10]|nr:hypothetical protein [Oscillatoria princeps RMCB-10]